jgi:hypothetical protein
VHEYVSAIHVHTLHSDGHSEVRDIAREGAAAGVDVVVITDHRNNEVRRLGKEGWYGDVLVVSGYELNDPEDKNHLLVFDLDECLDGRMGAKAYVREVAERGGIGIIAHPDERRDTFPEHPPYEWTDWPEDGIAGVEIWNYMSEWMEGLRPGKRLLTLAFPDLSILGPTDRVLEYWDRMAAGRPAVAIGSADAHCHQHKILGFTVSIFPYRKLFRRIRTHLLTEEPLSGDLARDRRSVFEALRHAHAFISNRKHGDARGFTFTARGRRGTSGMGGDMRLSDDPVLDVGLPRRGSLELIGNGRVLARSGKRRFSFRPREPGVYRIEVRRRGKPWIYSNHIRITT